MQNGSLPQTEKECWAGYEFHCFIHLFKEKNKVLHALTDDFIFLDMFVSLAHNS